MLTINLDKGGKPLYEQIYSHIKNEINTGNLSAGAKLPSTRALASHLSVSRNTVQMSYDQLLSEGYIDSKDRSGYIVSQITGSQKAKISQVKPAYKKATPSSPYKYDFSPFALDTGSFPYASWQRLNRRLLSERGSDLFLLGDRQGEYELRQAIAGYLAGFRGFNVSPDNIIICAGADYSFQLLIQLLSVPSAIAMENPCYMQAYRIFKGFGADIVPIPVTPSGHDLSGLEKSDAAAVYVTPSHQYPLGVIMSASKRKELLDIAAKTGKYIIEDDHDSEFRYKGRLIPALKELDENDRVIYLGTFSRTIAPAIRAGYMVLPDSLLEVYKSRFSHYASTVSRIDQLILAAFINEGSYERHLNRTRKLYRAKHDTLINAIKEAGSNARILDEDAGLHVTVSFPDIKNEEDMAASALNKGIRLYGISEFLFEKSDLTVSFAFGFAGLSQNDIKDGIRLLFGS
ncbi:MAG: PLP-dependent aminotransferase family protein [Lachnospiraceae bacterium]|nr:PLP-dependent aminotransferase family protein [Lachnospiraceae bacterium]